MLFRYVKYSILNKSEREQNGPLGALINWGIRYTATQVTERGSSNLHSILTERERARRRIDVFCSLPIALSRSNMPSIHFHSLAAARTMEAN
jgi:hypothetical protein